MSKNAFNQILRTAHLELSRHDLDLYWNMALNANLPCHIFKIIKHNLFFLPLVHDAYLKAGKIPEIVMTEDYARRFILDALALHGSLYMHEIQALFTLNSEVRISTIQNLIQDGFLTFKYCPLGDAISYELNAEKTVNEKEIHKALKAYIKDGRPRSLYSIWLYSSGFDYAEFCIFVYMARISNKLKSVFIYSDLMRAMLKHTKAI